VLVVAVLLEVLLAVLLSVLAAGADSVFFSAGLSDALDVERLSVL
jgi:hypothetical protein